jgi:hypothetical protein
MWDPVGCEQEAPESTIMRHKQSFYGRNVPVIANHPTKLMGMVASLTHALVAGGKTFLYRHPFRRITHFAPALPDRTGVGNQGADRAEIVLQTHEFCFWSIKVRPLRRYGSAESTGRPIGK